MENDPLKQNRRVEVDINGHKLAIRGLKNPVFTRISRLITRINPLKGTQVVDFPHIEENNARVGGSNFMISREKEKGGENFRSAPDGRQPLLHIDVAAGLD